MMFSVKHRWHAWEAKNVYEKYGVLGFSREALDEGADLGEALVLE